MFDTPKPHLQRFWIIFTLSLVVLSFIITVILVALIFVLPPDTAPLSANFNGTDWTFPADGTNSHPNPLIINNFYPKKIGLWIVFQVVAIGAGEPRIRYWFELSNEAIASIILIIICLISTIVTTLIARPKIKAWFRLSTFTRVTLLLAILNTFLLIIGLTDTPKHSIDQLNEAWQTNYDYDWSNWIFTHNPEMNTTYYAANSTYPHDNYYSRIGILMLIFSLVIMIWCFIDNAFGAILTINRYRFWKRYKKIDFSSLG